MRDDLDNAICCLLSEDYYDGSDDFGKTFGMLTREEFTEYNSDFFASSEEFDALVRVFEKNEAMLYWQTDQELVFHLGGSKENVQRSYLEFSNDYDTFCQAGDR